MKGASISSPHVHGDNSVSRVMLLVALALLPAYGAHLWLFGWGLLINVIVITAAAFATEAVMVKLRGRDALATLQDGSALLSALLLAIAMPPLAPWWLGVVGIAFAMIFAKHLFGGLGQNSFNPAMVAYVVLLISFPVQMTSWSAPLSMQEQPLTLAQSLDYSFTGQLPAGSTLDTLTHATTLDQMKTEVKRGYTVSETFGAPVFGAVAGKGWEIINGLLLLGGLWLLWKRIISWHVPVAMLATLFLLAGLFHLINPGYYPGPLFHIFSGGALLGAFFIATDPVTCATSVRGRLLFGCGVGLFTYVIRTWGGYPDGVAFSVLLMNMAAPAIDYFTQPRVFGHKS
ncbi:MAG TPA: electron transport complex subunit RsxD [Gammaproteobacteria bacterium]